jgi:subtilisin family serine protease
MDGRLKPDVMAPGVNIVSASNSYYLDHHTKLSDRESHISFFDFNGRTYGWMANSGTSMACPVVAGTIALWLQANPRLTRQDVMDIIRRTSRQHQSPTAYPNNEYGYGEIDAYRGLLDILGLSKIDAISQQPVNGVDIRPANGSLTLTFSHRPIAPVRISLYTTSGRLCWQTTLSHPSANIQLPLPTLPTGIYAVQLNTADPSLCGSALIRL